MKAIIWYILGLIALLTLALVLSLSALQNTWAHDLLPSSDQPPNPQNTPSEPPESLFTTLEWRREGGRARSCDQMTIDHSFRPHYARCGHATVVGALTAEEMQTYLMYVARYAPFDVTMQDNPDGEDNLVLRLRFPGRGARRSIAEEQVQVARWVAQVYDRLTREQRENDLVASTRTLLAQRLGISPDDITTYRVEAITWPNACLDVRVRGMDCTLVQTPGYRILLEANGLVYEYRTDLHDKVYGLEMPVTPEPSTPAPTPESPAATQTVVPPTETPTATPTPVASTPTATAAPTSTPLQITEWRGEYFSNLHLSGTPHLVRNDPAVSFDWGHEAPAEGLPADGFSARWTRRMHLAAGWYSFRLRGDDGVRLRLDGHVVIDRWDEGWSDDTVKLYLWAGQHEMMVEFYEYRDAAGVDLRWEELASAPDPTATSEPTATMPRESSDDAWTVAYWNEEAPEGEPVLTQHERRLDLNWGKGSPDRRVRRDRFSARFTRTLVLPEGTYRLRVRADDRARVYIDDELVIDGWRGASGKRLTERVRLSGTHTFRIDYAEIMGRASISFEIDRENRD